MVSFFIFLLSFRRQTEMSNKGNLTLYIGPMFAGKTTHLINSILQYSKQRKSCITFKFSQDNRYSVSKVVSHDHLLLDAVSCSELMPFLSKAVEFDVIAIDEGQFFPDIVEFAEALFSNNKTIIISCLDGTYQRKPFGDVLELITIAEPFKKMHAKDLETNTSAAFSKRIVNIDKLVVIGSGEIYHSTNRMDYFNKLTNGEIHLFLSQSLEKRKKFIAQGLKNKTNIYKINTSDQNSENLSLPDIEQMRQYDVIAIDDISVFPNICDWADSLANDGKLVILSSPILSQHDKKPRKELINLIPLCEYVEKDGSI